MLTIVEIFDGYLQAALGKVAFSYGLAKLFVGEKRQKDFTFLTDETQESSPRISLTFFKIGIADNNCFDGRILNFRIALATVIPSTSKDTSLIDGLRSRRAIKPVDRHASNSGFAT